MINLAFVTNNREVQGNAIKTVFLAAKPAQNGQYAD